MATLTNNRITSDLEKAQKAGYNKGNYERGWGIGDSSNVSMGFNNFSDSNALRNEINRVNTVMGNRTGFGLDNNHYNSYAQQLQSAYKPFTDAQNKSNKAQTDWSSLYNQQQQQYNDAFGQFNNQINNAQNSYYDGAGYKNYQDSMNQTIDSIAGKYGFTFNRDTARQQAEAQAQALRDANADASRRNKSQNELNLAGIDANLMNMSESLDRNYFQQMMQQQQNQVNTGLNAGIASDQDLRLQMARQAEMGSAYRDANLGRMQEGQRFTNEDLRLAEALGTINQQALANADKAVRDYEMDMYNIISNDRNQFMNAANMEWGQSQDVVNRLMQQQNMLTDNYRWQTGFDYGQARDLIGDSMADRDFAQRQFENSQAQQNLDRNFNYQTGRDAVGDNQWQQQFNWGKVMDEAGLTGMYNGNRTMQGQQLDWGRLMDEAGLTGMYNGNPTWGRIMDEAGLTGLYNGSPTWDRVMDEFNMNMANREFGLRQRQMQAGGRGGTRSGGGGGGNSAASSAAAQQNMNWMEELYAQYLRDVERSNNPAAERTNAGSNYRGVPQKWTMMGT